MKYFIVLDNEDDSFYLCTGIENVSEDDTIIESYNDLSSAERRLCLEINRSEGG